ncbi:hypothetical protein KUTeg_017218 [Tegillarca granosa]|uniref:Uncharacterized protein n=1 Tax=Tegillarca granosa TaxID=220873 RepID=A0ABQ9EJ01_TEGGR|nr:hypothetical protein KUTeg_017218 [Tegillarca granosa]
MAAKISYSERDLDIIPEITFCFVENYIKSKKDSSGKKSINKGFKYFSEGYITELKDGCKVTGKCFRSQRKNEEPHSLSVSFDKAQELPEISSAYCSCAIGLSGACGHGRARRCIENIIATNMAYSEGCERIRAKAMQDLSVSGYHSSDITRETTPRTVKSTLYNPVCGDTLDWSIP